MYKITVVARKSTFYFFAIYNRVHSLLLLPGTFHPFPLQHHSFPSPALHTLISPNHLPASLDS